MKVLLINPSCQYYIGSKGPRTNLPLGLLYIASYLEKHNINVKIFDCLISEKTEIIKKDNVITHGIRDQYLKDIIKKEMPDIIGVSIPFSAQVKTALKTIKLIKKINKNIIIVVGGPHVSVSSEEILKNNHEIDYAISGEGERSLYQLISFLKKELSIEEVSGLTYSISDKKEKKIIKNDLKFIDDLDNEIRFPAYHLLDMELFFNLQKKIKGRKKFKDDTRSIAMITSRGCPFNCVFCSIHLHMGKKYRHHSSNHVIEHIEYVKNKYGVSHISFDDDNFALKYSRMEEICDSVKNKKLNIKWHTPNGVRPDNLDENLLEKMKEAGCEELTIAIESGVQSTLDNIINKKLDLNKCKEVIRICKKLNINLNAFYVIGFPGETMGDIRVTIDLALDFYKKYNVYPSIFSATPLIGTLLFDIVEKHNYLDREINAFNLSIATQPITGNPIIKTNEFSPSDIKEIAQYFNQERKKIGHILKP